MVVLRFQRRGKKHQPTFRIVADTKRSKLDGASIEDLGWYNPHSKESLLKEDRIKYWLSVGAKPSNTVYNLLISKSVIDGKKIAVHNKSKKKEEEKSPDASTQEPTQEPIKETEIKNKEEVEEVKEEVTPETTAFEEKTEEAPTEETKEGEVPITEKSE